MIDRAPVPPVHGMLRILQAGLTNTPVDKAGYEATINAVTGGQETRASLRRVMVGQNPTRDEREAFRKTIEAARDFVTLTQDSSTITPERRTAAIATLNILLAAGAHQKAYDREAAQLVTRANPLLFSEDPHGGAAVALYTVATILQTQERMMQTMKWGVMGLEREAAGQQGGSNAALTEIQRLQENVDDIKKAGGQGAAERFFKTHSLDEEDRT